MRKGRRSNLHDSESGALPILPPQFSSAGEGFEGFVLEHHRQHAFELPPLSAAAHCVLLTLGRSFRVEIRRGGERCGHRVERGDVCVFPYGFGIDGASVEPCEFLVLFINPSAVGRAAGGDGRAEVKPRIGVADPLAAQMLHDLLRELKAGANVRRPHVEALVEALSVHLVRHYSSGPRAVRGQDEGVPDYVLSGAVAFIEDSLEHELSPAEIARAAGLSPARFARAFKAATGKTVRQYVDERRVEKAKPLLADGVLTPEEVARRVGFESPRRFAAVFRKLTGVPARSYGRRTRSS
jgi:AraC family transcriptional regulator